MDILQSYVNEIGWCVSVTPLTYFYKENYEKGFVVGIINYPRFPSSVSELKKRTIKLAFELRDKLCQLRVSVEFPKQTFTLDQDDNLQKVLQACLKG